MPDMGILSSETARRSPGTMPPTPAPGSLADALFTTTQQRVLGFLFGQPDRSFMVTELIALTGAGSGAVQRELARLHGSGLLTLRKLGNQRHYQANAAAPIHSELVGIIQKTSGLAEPLRAALTPHAHDIAAAFVYGSVAKKSDTASSDIDLMVLSDTLGYGDIFAAVEAASMRLGRSINPTVYTRATFAERIRSGNAFVTRLLAQPKLWLMGSEHDIPA